MSTGANKADQTSDSKNGQIKTGPVSVRNEMANQMQGTPKNQSSTASSEKRGPQMRG